MCCEICMLSRFFYSISIVYPLVNEQLDPENHQFLVETNLPTPMTGRVYVNLLEGNWDMFGVYN